MPAIFFRTVLQYSSEKQAFIRSKKKSFVCQHDKDRQISAVIKLAVTARLRSFN